MLEKLLTKVALTILEKLGAWAAEYVAKLYEEWQQDKRDEDKRKKLNEAKTKEERIRRAKDLVDSATKPTS